MFLQNVVCRATSVQIISLSTVFSTAISSSSCRLPANMRTECYFTCTAFKLGADYDSRKVMVSSVTSIPKTECASQNSCENPHWSSRRCQKYSTLIDPGSRGANMESSEGRSVLLPSGHRMPLVGLGTWQAKDEEVEAAVSEALSAGYRHIDTAFNYGNEYAIGRVLKRWINGDANKRSQLFITTKLPVYGNRPSDVEKYITESLKRLQVDYLDLYLVHMPFSLMPDESGENFATNPDGSPVIDMNTDHVQVWKAMESQVDAGRVKSIGVSNFNIDQVSRLCSIARHPVSCNQVELHAFNQQQELRKQCTNCCSKIVFTAYSPLGSPGAPQHFLNKYGYHVKPDSAGLLENPVVLEVAASHSKSPAQVLLRHLVQQGICVIPKSVSPQRIKQNSEVFDFTLSESDMQKLNSLDRGENGRTFNFLFFKGIENHPEYPFKKN